jgi:hypothetical protein
MNNVLSYASKRIPFAAQHASKNASVDEQGDPLADDYKFSQYQPTCYGNFGTAFFKGSQAINGGVRARADCAHQM